MIKAYIVPLALVSLLLTGCQTTFDHKTGVFRNREFDYLHQSVDYRPPLVVPPGVDAPKFEPKNILPAGSNSYPAQNSVDMTPPGFAKIVPIPGEASKTPAAKGTPAKVSSTALNSPDNIKAQIQSLQTQIAALKTKQSASTTTSVPEISSSTLSKPASTALLSPITSILQFGNNNVGLLTINAPFKESWDALENAIQQSGYTITQIDQGSHIIYVTAPPSNDPQAKPNRSLLFVNRKDNATQVSVFTDKGVLDSSAEANSLLTQLQAKLSQPGSS